MKKKYGKKRATGFYTLITLLMLVLAAWWFAPVYLPFVATFLHIEKPIAHAQVGVVLSGDDGERVVLAAKLYKQKKVDYLLMTGGPTFQTTMADQMKAYAITLGVPSKKIWMEKKASSTQENAIYSREILDQKHVQSILIITSKYHTRRAWSAYQKAYNGRPISMGIIGAEDSIKIEKWWKTPSAKELVILEWVKTVVYWTR